MEEVKFVVVGKESAWDSVFTKQQMLGRRRTRRTIRGGGRRRRRKGRGRIRKKVRRCFTPVIIREYALHGDVVVSLEEVNIVEVEKPPSWDSFA